MEVRARSAWTPDGLLHDAVVEVDGRRIREVRPARPGDPPALDGMLVPGLVNAHLHLEVSSLAGRIPRGLGFFDWLEAQFAARSDADGRADAAAAAHAMAHAGTVAVCDISNRGDTAPLFADAGIVGIVQHELLTLDAAKVPAQLEHARIPARWERGVWTRPAPHAPYSTADALIRAAASPGPAPSSIHLAETGAERVFLETGGGAFAELLDRLGVDASAFTAPACGPVAYLRRLGVLRPDVLLVHGVDLSPGEWREVAAAGAPVCLCPRSNLYIGGVLPDVGAAFASGARLCLGTDSLASNDDLDILGELPVLIEAFPDVPAGRWLDLATAGGADALGLPLGRLQPGLAPGLVLLRGVTHPDDLATVPARSVVLPAEMP